MAEEKVTIMKLKVDLQCSKCYKKVKKVLCKFPQIRDQVYDEKQGIVTIKVVCCNPEKLRDKICCKGCGSIKSIEIVEPPKPKPEEPEKKKEPNKTKEKPATGPEAEKPPPKPVKPNPARAPAPATLAPPVAYPFPLAGVPVGVCCVSCYEGQPGGPCFQGYGPPICCDGYYGRPAYDSYGGCRPYYASRCDQYFSEENSRGCTIM